VVRALAFAGRLRPDSWSGKLLRLAIEAAMAAGFDATGFDLAGVPLCSADEEPRGFPPAVEALRQAVATSRA
jgi:NAD(P)H-dependent FMN reductase